MSRKHVSNSSPLRIEQFTICLSHAFPLASIFDTFQLLIIFSPIFLIESLLGVRCCSGVLLLVFPLFVGVLCCCCSLSCRSFACSFLRPSLCFLFLVAVVLVVVVRRFSFVLFRLLLGCRHRLWRALCDVNQGRVGLTRGI